MPGYDAAGWAMLIAPAKTPRPILTRLNAEVTLLHHQPTRESIAATARRLGIASPQAVEAVARGMARAREADRAGDLDACLRSLVDVQIAIER